MTPDKIRDAWNKQADQYNQWAELDWEEMIAWTIKCLSTPPAAQRQWVGLTQQDIDIAFDDTQDGGGFNEFACAIEAKLKEKNK